MKANTNSKKCLMEGINHDWVLCSEIYLQWGSSPNDIILKNHVDIYGTLVSINHGKIIDEWSQLGNNCLQ